MNKFYASTSYNDMKGSAAADRADFRSSGSWLKENGHINNDEYVLGITMSLVENHGTSESVVVEFLVSGLQGHEGVNDLLRDKNDCFNVRSIDVIMNFGDFLSLFKRLEITLSNKGLLEDKCYISK